MNKKIQNSDSVKNLIFEIFTLTFKVMFSTIKIGYYKFIKNLLITKLFFKQN